MLWLVFVVFFCTWLVTRTFLIPGTMPVLEWMSRLLLAVAGLALAGQWVLALVNRRNATECRLSPAAR